jgi:hypothetical protein
VDGGLEGSLLYEERGRLPDARTRVKKVRE